jgi:hypothetical protein
MATFNIFATPLAVNEGANVTFTIYGKDVSPGIPVSYTIVGITQDDLAVGNVRGTIIMGPAGEPYSSAANITVRTSEDFVTEGTESISLVLSALYPFNVEENQNAIILDSSIQTSPSYTLTSNILSVTEGLESILITVNTENVPNDTVLPYSINPQFNSRFSPSDFSSNSFTGVFPEIQGNTASIILRTINNGFGDLTRFFNVSIDLPGISVTSPVIELRDAGDVVVSADDIFSGDATISFKDITTFDVELGGETYKKEYFEDSSGKLSDIMVLQGRSRGSVSGPILYQPFSYVIRSGKSIETWERRIKSILNPAGMLAFGEVNSETTQDTLKNINIEATLASEIKSYFEITADNRRPPIRASANTYSNSRGNIDLTADFTFTFFGYL